jgi:hypothetical protein
MSGSTAARPRRLGLILPFVLLIVLALGWTGLWFYGRHRIGLELDNFFARQASLGRVWSCPDRTIGGYPFRIEVACRAPTFATRQGAPTEVTGKLERLSVTAQTAGAFNLAHVVSRFEGPLVINEAGFGRTTVTWKEALGSFRGTHRRVERTSIDMKEIEALIEPKDADTVRLKAASFEAHLREGVSPAEPGAYDIAIRLNGAVIPPLDRAMNSADPVNLLLDGKALNIGAIDRRDWRATLENWRLAKGAFRVEQFTLAKGAPRLEAKGDLRLDAEKRLEGRLDANFVNAGPLLSQLGINVGGGAAGALLGGLLGGSRAQGEPQRDRALRLPLVLGDGRLAVGPFRVPGVVLRPLY